MDSILSVIIVSWNTRELLLRCLESVYATRAGLPLEVIVVDNASTDESARSVRERYPDLRLSVNAENVGFARANNQAILASVGRYVLLLNPDTEVRPGGLQALVEYLEAHPEAGGAGSLLLNPDGTLQQSCYPAPTLSREAWRLFHLDSIHSYGSYRMASWDRSIAGREVDVIQGASLLLRRDALDQVGLLDEGYFVYSEEVDLCHRLRQRGWRLYWVPRSVVMHYGGQSTRQVATAMFVRLYQGKIHYFRRRHSAQAAMTYKLIVLLASCTRLFFTPMAWLEDPSKRRRHLALASYYWQLIKALPAL